VNRRDIALFQASTYPAIQLRFLNTDILRTVVQHGGADETRILRFGPVVQHGGADESRPTLKEVAFETHTDVVGGSVGGGGDAGDERLARYGKGG
jgi:hypothetical protein